MRYGPSRVSINTNTALRDIYNHKANVQKSSYYSIFSHYFKAPSVLTAISAKDHGRKRRIVAQGLSDSAIQAMEDHVLENVRNFCSKLISNDCQGFRQPSGMDKKSNGWSSGKDISQWTAYLTFDIMGDLCFSQSFNMLDSPGNHYMLKVLPAGVQGLNIVRQNFPVYHRLTDMLVDGTYARSCEPPPRPNLVQESSKSECSI